jgi:hypothetical protein
VRFDAKLKEKQDTILATYGGSVLFVIKIDRENLYTI